MLSNANNAQRSPAVTHRIPEIHGIESSPSSMSASNPRMNPMLLHNNDNSNNNADNVKREEPRSPQPSSLKQNQKDTPTESIGTTNAVVEDEEMSEPVHEAESTGKEAVDAENATSAAANTTVAKDEVEDEEMKERDA